MPPPAMTTRSPGPSRFDIETRGPCGAGLGLRIGQSIGRGGVNRALDENSRGHVSSLDGGLASESMVTYKINTWCSVKFLG